jgi:c-di-AMP phosphodiesterase-like protein
MIKILSRLRSSILLILFFELLIISSLIAVYYYDILSVQAWLTFPILFSLIDVFFLLNSKFMLSFLATILLNRQKKDLKTADLLGSDIPEAYRYTGLGIILLDQDEQVIWVNEVIQDLQPNLIETNIHDWKEELVPLLQGTKTTAQAYKALAVADAV